MAINFLNSIDLNQLELIHAVIENQATDALAGTGVDGQVYYNTTDKLIKVYDAGASAWKTVGKYDDLNFTVTSGTNSGVMSLRNGVTIIDSVTFQATPGQGLSISAANDIITINHADTSSVSDSDNANGVVLQDITFDTFGHVQTIGTTDLDSRYVQSVTGGDGITVTGGTGSTPAVAVDYSSGADNLINSATATTLFATGIPYTNYLLTAVDNPGVANGETKKIRSENIPLNAFGAADGDISLGNNKITSVANPTSNQDAATKQYVDAAVIGLLEYQGGYNASTNSPALDTAISISAVGSGSGPFTGTVPTTGGSGTGMTVYAATNPSGGLITARVVNGGSGYVVGDIISLTIANHSGQGVAVGSVPIANIEKGWTYTITTGGYFYNELVGPGDVIIAEVNVPTEQDAWTKVQNNIDLADELQVGIGNVVAGTSETITAPYTNGTATLDVVDSTAIQKGAVIVAAGDGIGVAYSSGTATVSLDKISFTNTGPATASTSYTIPGTTHFLGNDSSIIMVQLVEVATGETVYADVTRGASGLITITFAESQAANSYRALLQKIV